jgi:hypothetical protein
MAQKCVGAIAFLLLGSLLAGCFDVEQSLRLERDLSGQASFSMTVNLEPLADMAVRMQRGMAGKQGEPTPAELAAARQEFIASRKKSDTDFTAKRAAFEKSLPPGVKLLDARVDDQGLKVVAHFTFAFDNVAKLSQVQFPSEGGKQQQQPGGKNPFDQPFAGLRVVDEGPTILVTSVPTNPLPNNQGSKPGAGGGEAMPPEAKKQLEEAFKGLHIGFKIDTPLTVLSSNATRREGSTLYWDYDLDSMIKMSQQQAAEGVRARFRK